MMVTKLNEDELPKVYELAFEAWEDAYAGYSEAFVQKVSEFIVKKPSMQLLTKLKRREK